MYFKYTVVPFSHPLTRMVGYVLIHSHKLHSIGYSKPKMNMHNTVAFNVDPLRSNLCMIAFRGSCSKLFLQILAQCLIPNKFTNK